MKKTLLSSFVAFGLAVLPLSAQAGTVTVKGSDTMVILAQRWAEAFMKKNPSMKIQVTGGGSGTGLAALQNGTTDIAMSSREIKEAEEEKLRARYNTPPTGVAVAKDGVTFYVNESNKVDALTVEQLKEIYLGDTASWKAVGGADAPIVLYSRENSSGTYVFVKDTVLGGDDFASAAQTLPGTAAVVNAVAKEKNGIGYGGAAYAKGIKELKVKKGAEAFAPSAENVKSGKYPLSRDLFFYLRNKPAGDVKAFIDFALSAEGQAIVTQVGYFPVK
ncbi:MULTISPECIES: phosphate ABC transporter substrate-binding protein [Corallococcus]|uniref:phosphate ABC transporter substrate-binding protein n=1 Tax=Corallococcus TaxID=83461 RepID=UPI00117E52B7|nr:MULTISPECIES: phosphate ABC transporter substrate-binding protein [Corallococcus]NBD14396.1 phosphate ABC transporter substrate-binding protein PstS family protein [Corallococcus silvisoli]TSC22706.1 phosphate ABC transporter substrate-binding protein [Corallococcus sp. Z5C101001]